MESNEFDYTNKIIGGLDNVYYSVGQVAKILEVPYSKVNYYCNYFDSLLNLEIINTQRKFKKNDIEKLKFILQLKDEGLSREQIKSYCQEVDFDINTGLQVKESTPMSIQTLAKAIISEMQGEMIGNLRQEVAIQVRNELNTLLEAQYQANDELKQDICTSIDELVDEKLSKQIEKIADIQKEESKITIETLNEMNTQLQEIKKTAYVTAEEISKQKKEPPNRLWKWFMGWK